MGFKKIILPCGNAKKLGSSMGDDVLIQGVKDINEAICASFL